MQLKNYSPLEKQDFSFVLCSMELVLYGAFILKNSINRLFKKKKKSKIWKLKCGFADISSMLMVSDKSATSHWFSPQTLLRIDCFSASQQRKRVCRCGLYIRLRRSVVRMCLAAMSSSLRRWAVSGGQLDSSCNMPFTICWENFATRS